MLPQNHEKIFNSSAYSHIASSIVDARDIIKGYTINTYMSNRDVDKFSNEVVIDIDLEAMAMTNVTQADYVDGHFQYQDGQPPSEKWTFLVFQYGSVYESKPSLKELKDKLVSHYQGLVYPAFDATLVRFSNLNSNSSFRTSAAFLPSLYARFY